MIGERVKRRADAREQRMVKTTPLALRGQVAQEMR
jgi:hypothetical protein